MVDLAPNPAVEGLEPRPRLESVFRHWNGLLEALPVGVYVCDAEGAVLYWNERAAQLWGQIPPAEARFCGSLRLFWPDGRPLAPEDCPMADALRDGRAARDGEILIERPDGSRIDALVNIEPLRDADGAVVGAVNCFQDVTELKRSKARWKRFDTWVREVFERSPVAMYVTDPAGRVQSFNRAAAQLWGRKPVLGEDLWCGSYRLYHPDGREMPLETCPMAVALKSGEARQGLEAIYERPDGHKGAFLAYPTLLHDDAGKVAGAVNMLVDITDRKQAEERQRILVDELNHRVKNTLASVQSLAAHSLRGRLDPDAMRERFEARIVALSAAHNRLADRRWQDAELLGLAQDVLGPYCADHRVHLEGDPVTVSAPTAVSLSMVLHELATNAVKYGALSEPQGQLRLSWRRDGPSWLRLEWLEADGPRVAEPERQGFGTRFVARSVAGEMGGRIEHAFEPDGVCCRIEIPL